MSTEPPGRDDDPSDRRSDGAPAAAGALPPAASVAAAAAEPSGPDLARAALAQAKARARERGLAPRARRSRRPADRPGSGADDRDPMVFGAAIRRLVSEQGWEATTSAARVLAEWDQLVGPAVADHCRPAALLDGELVLIAESSAWATQIRLMSRMLLTRLAAQVGADVVRRVVVRGPTQPDWRHGARRVQGRGPRDTYG